MALVGPNCFGVLNQLDHVALWGTADIKPTHVARGVAVLSQSGYWLLNIVNNRRSLPVACAISMGNQAVLNVADYMDALLEDPRITAIGLYLENIPDPLAFSRAAAKAHERGVPIVVVKGGSTERGLDEALIAVSSAIGYGAFRRMRGAEESSGDLALSPPPSRAAGNPVLLDEGDAKQRLAAFGLPIPKGLRANRAELGRCADQIGFPVALKVLSNELAHKSAVGGVALALRSDAAVEEAARDMIQLLEANAPHITVEWFLVETMIERVVAELIIGVKRDDKFGFALGVGAGGVGVASQHERRTVLLPATRAAMRRALESLEIVQRCTEAGASLESVLDAAGAIATFADANRTTLVELDVNPLLVREGGGGVIAADVLARIRS